MRIPTILAAVLVLAACGGSDPGSTSVPEGATPVNGTAICDPAGKTVRDSGEEMTVTARWTCEMDATDARVSGLLEMQVDETVADAAIGGWASSDDAVLTADDGTWSGELTAAMSYDSVLPQARYIDPIWMGQARLTGDDGLDGLQLDLYVAAGYYDQQIELGFAGWIADAG
ncbi:hypothetical protein [Demequina maris]|uniref:hypothetical protein n=1 Tax=Demequina maris TaxID=1638982 RepID=UPI00078253AA|nr:hypothetical protein [Demequina maris]